MKMCKLLAVIAYTVAIALLGFYAGKKSAGEKVEVYETSYDDSLTEWQIVELAIFKTESEFNPSVTGKNGDWGLAQITPIYVEEVNRILGEDRYCHEDAFSPEKTHEMFIIMQTHYNPTNDTDKAIKNHNPGASKAYHTKVCKNIEWINNYENIRKIVR